MTERMNAEVKALWVASLRSGDFEQGKGALHRVVDVNGNGPEKHEFCCLGVLSECAVAAGTAEREFQEEAAYFKYFDANDQEFGGNAHYLPRVVKSWADLEEGNPSLEYQGEFHSLADLNDSYGLSFSQIADLIDEQL